MCDYWLWQREYRKRWILYSEEEIQTLNKAVGDKELSATLAGKNNSKLIIDFEKMVQRNTVSLYEQRVRCLVLSSNYYSWQWKDDEEWCSFNPNVSALLEKAHLNGDKLLSFSLNEDFEVNLENLELTNKSDMQVFPVERKQIQITSSVNIKDIQEMGSTQLASLQLKKQSNKRKLDDLAVPSIPSVVLDEKTSAFTTSSEAKIAVDGECPQKNSYHIYAKEGIIFSATLNQTNLQNNNNKFYIIQLLEHNETGQFAVWRRWGRVGARGQNDFTLQGRDLEAAKTSFGKKFFDKTKNHWSDIKNFEFHPGKYDLLQMDLTSSPEQAKKVKQNPEVESKLEFRVKALMEIICDQKLLEGVLKDMSFDSNKTPLGKITLKQVKDGYIALNKISEILKRSGGRIDSKELVNACNAFYTKIPHSFGMKTPPLIKTQLDVDAKINMLEALANITVAMGVLNDRSTRIEHPLDKHFQSLDCSLEALDISSPEFQAFEQCLQGTHGPTHSSYKMEVVDVFRCHKAREETLFRDFKNKHLLWHGSRISNWIGILKQGLLIAPPEAPTTGYMFGKGVYFADVSSKSANYCYASKRQNEGVLLLCEVSLGNQHCLNEANERLPNTLPSGFNSVKGCGRTSPSEYKCGVLSSEAKVPVGPLIENDMHTGSLIYNEYIVYDTKQIKMKYIARVKFNFK